MKNQHLTKLLFCCTPLALTGCAEAEKEAPKQPNIIYILADDLGYGDIEPYGQSIIKTPHLSRMAEEGMLFTQHYAGCTVSAPSRGSVMTGLHTGHSQIRGNRELSPEGQQPMEAGTYTVGSLMKSAGYSTGIFGKWGLGAPGSASTPSQMGFDEFYGYLCQRQAHTYYPEHLWKNDSKVVFEENFNEGRETYSQDLIHQEALSFIRANKDKPFFAMLTYTLPHAELNLPHDSIYDLYVDQFDEKPFDVPNSYYKSEQPKASFAAMVTRLDYYVGEVLAELKELGIDDNTIVLFTSDNGPHREGGAQPDFFKSYGPLRGVKRDLYEGGIRVPFIVRYPGVVKQGVKSDHLSAFWDFMPTLADLANVELPADKETDGISYYPLLTNSGKQEVHDHLYWEFHEMGGRIAVRKGDWKAVALNVFTTEKVSVELFNLSDDLGETTDVAADYPEKVEELIEIMKHEHVETPIFPFCERVK